MKNNLELDSFYPKEFFNIIQIVHDENQINIYLKSVTDTYHCPICGFEMKRCHGTYTRTVQDLPILGKKVILFITAHEYNCLNEDCNTKSIAEDYKDFIGRFSRMTNRCEDFIVTLALETSCEGASRICHEIGIKISGDTIIRILKKRYQSIDSLTVDDHIGVDDFSTKKGEKYCTIVCNGTSHKPIAVLDGRNGTTLKEWLMKNKHVKTITRDRASAYAKAISEALPSAMQIADRFHLHQNLLDAVKKALSKSLPQIIKMESAEFDIFTETKIINESGTQNNNYENNKKNE